MRAHFFFELLLVAYASAECCKRKADYGCCGKSPGSCGVFCCNCGGCNKQCEYTTCATMIWMRCSGAIDKCIDKCGNKDSEDCKACLKADYASCKDCIVTADKLKGFEGTRKDDLEKDRVAFFNEIQGGKDIDPPTLKEYVKKARTLPGSGVDSSKQGSITFEDAFKIIDPDNDGDIGRGEFDNDKLQFKVGDLIIPELAAAPPKPPPTKADTTEVKPKTDQPVVTAEKPTTTTTELHTADVTPTETTTEDQPTTTDTKPVARRKRVETFFGNDNLFSDFGA